MPFARSVSAWGPVVTGFGKPYASDVQIVKEAVPCKCVKGGHLIPREESRFL